MLGVISPVFIYEPNEYYGYTLYYIIIVAVCLITFWIIFLLVGLILKNKLKKKELWFGFKISTKFSMLISLCILIVGFIAYLIKQNDYSKEYEMQRKKYEAQKFQEINFTVDSLQMEIRKDSTNSSAYFELSMLYRTIGNYDKSIEYYKIAIKRDSTIEKYKSELENRKN